MRKFGIIFIIAIFFVACTSTPKTDQSNNDGNTENNTIQGSKDQNSVGENNNISEVSKPVPLSEDGFADKVFDFRKSGKWKYKGDKPCIIDFYADWCGPCRQIAPFMVEFAATYKDQIYVYKVNTDNAQNLSAFFSIDAIPAVMLCPMKGDYQMIVGANAKTQYVSLIESVLLAKK